MIKDKVSPTAEVMFGKRAAELKPERVLSVILPAYNEEGSLSTLLDRIERVLKAHEIKKEVIVVDDGSTDTTPDIAREKGAIVVQHKVNKGYGAALKTGILQSRYADILIIDADGTYPPEAIPTLLERFDGNDMVVGARGGHEASLAGLRRLAKWSLRVLAGYCTGVRIVDLNSGMRLLKKDAVRTYSHLLPSGFSFTSTITIALLCHNRRVEYVPIDYHPRGNSKFLPFRETFKIFWQVLKTMVRLTPLKVFLPLSIFSLAVGVYVAANQAISGRTFSIFPLLCISIGLLFGFSGLMAKWIFNRSISFH